jgi:DNA-directed RNA polymerase subunit M/transcription elongation factor TFIIS
MKFCPVCRNVLYSIDEEEGHAILNCRKCEYKEEISKDNSIVYEHILKEDSSVKLVMNPYLKHDPTLPRFSEIDCPNKECLTKKGTKNDIVGVKIDKQNLIWMYQCSVCDTTWKQNSQAT